MRSVLALLLGLVLLTSCQAKTHDPGGPLPLDKLSMAITGVGAARTAVLSAVQDVEDGAEALDATDAICVTGRGVAARASYRKGQAAYGKAGPALRNLQATVSNYRAALRSLDGNRSAVTGAANTALAAVVRDGGTEATAVAGFASAVGKLWPQYVNLEGQEKVWITRAVTPWYRTDQEAANAYAVLVGSARNFLEVARTRLMNASAALRTATSVASATLAQADAALAAASKKSPP
jgi:hypothetical protein